MKVRWLLSGEAGIGKSRLTAALLERLADEPHTRLRYFCSPQHTDSALYPVLDPPDTRSWRDLIRAQESGLPSDRHPDRTKRAVVLEAVKVWPGKGGVRRKVGASANLDSSCARWLCDTAGRGEETELQVEQRNRSRQCAPL